MERIKEQFSKITKDVREKNKLSQEDMASKLYLSGKQTIYYYEKGKRIMKLPEFVEFIQTFNETVVINKDGIALIDSESNIKNNQEEKGMKNEKNNLKLLEERGSISFYEDTQNEKQYQQVEGIGLIPVLDGKMEYQTIQTFGDMAIKYNLNGYDGYSIWSGDICYEDNFWSLEQVQNAVDELFLSSQKEKAISVMSINLENKLEDEEIELSELDFSNVESFLNSLDDVFLDEGQFRCEGFMDIAIPYALNFGEMESNTFYNALWECAEEVFEEFKRESIKTVTCKYSNYSDDEIKFDYLQNNNDSYRVILRKNNKKLIFKEFYFGCDNPDLKTVMEAVKDDYTLFKTSPNLKEYIANRGEVENIELEYDALRLDVKSMAQFFGKEYLNNLISE